jgi:type VI protein secretion system component Hcp
MKKLIIEWQHLDVDGETCDRCYDTGETLTAEVKRLNRMLNPKGFEVEYIETKLDNTQISQSSPSKSPIKSLKKQAKYAIIELKEEGYKNAVQLFYTPLPLVLL